VKPYFEEAGITIYHGDCLELLSEMPRCDVAIVDPEYGVTSLGWDKRDARWIGLVNVPTFWCFGSLRFFLESASAFSGWTYAQEIVWEKHNGSIFHADRFRRVHELTVQFYRGEWATIFKEPQFTNDATARTTRRKGRPPHTGEIAGSFHVSEDGGPRLMRSVLQVRSCHGYAEHPTQKPEGIVEPLIRYSCPPDGTVISPFAGSGTDLVVAKRLGLRAIGIEIEEKYCEIATKRLGQSVMNFGADVNG
jgi:site-specific DNA-methyltransferase (adenine-specific)